jgi:hypothetical protein
MQLLHRRNAGKTSPGGLTAFARRLRAGLLLLVGLLLLCVSGAGSAGAAVVQIPRPAAYAQARSLPANPRDVRMRRLIQEGRVASTVRVLDSLAPTLIVQFPLIPSGLKTAFPKASALVTIVNGDERSSIFDTVTVDVQNMPPNITFTIFLIELANKPFGNVEYVADLTTRGDGSGETIFQCITFDAFAMDARNPGSSVDGREGTTSGVNLEHMGMWFSSLKDAQQVLNDDSLQGTIFDGGNPPLHAGPQAMTDGQSAPVF